MRSLFHWLLVVFVSAASVCAAQPMFDGVRARESTERYLQELRDGFTNSVGMEFVSINPGSFFMGCDTADADEAPRHRVEIPEGFFLGATEVTQAQWEKVMGYNPSLFKDPDRPVEKVAWIEVVSFVRRLNVLENTDRYSLPTEAEWEYACRAGGDSAYYWGDEIDGRFAWYRDNAGGQTHRVKELPPNAWGLYDMAGNVSEWVLDIYAPYPGSSLELPAQDEHPTPVTRGGSWNSHGRDLRSSNRSRLWEHYRLAYTGFRIKARR